MKIPSIITTPIYYLSLTLPVVKIISKQCTITLIASCIFKSMAPLPSVALVGFSSLGLHVFNLLQTKYPILKNIPMTQAGKIAAAYLTSLKIVSYLGHEISGKNLCLIIMALSISDFIIDKISNLNKNPEPAEDIFEEEPSLLPVTPKSSVKKTNTSRKKHVQFRSQQSMGSPLFKNPSGLTPRAIRSLHRNTLRETPQKINVKT